MREAYFRRWSYSIPDEWNELNRKQLLAVIKVMYDEKGDDRGLLLLFRALARIPWWQFFMMRSPNLLEAAYDATAFLFQENKLTKNILTFYKGFAGPADQLTNVKMGEFCFSEFYYLQYKTNNETKPLDRLVATLYRPRKHWLFYNYRKNFEGDYRKPFSPHTIMYYSENISKWPLHIKHAIFQFYEGARAEKIASNPRVFESSTGEESLYGLWSVMRSVAKSGHFGDLDKVQDQYVDTLLMELNETVVEAERIEMERNKVTAER
jgi:hypothetical protein